MKMTVSGWYLLVATMALTTMVGCQGLSTGGSQQTQPGAGQISFSPTSVAFGKVLVGNNQSQPVTMTNSGASTVSVTKATVTGTAFAISGLSLPMDLAAGQSHSFTVVFTPQSTAAATGNIAITNNGATPTVNLSLSGNGQADGALTVNPTSLNFGSVQEGASQPLTETLQNTGGSSIVVSQVAATGDFSVGGLSLPLTLQAGQSQPFTVTFSPKSAGSESGNVSITSTGVNPSVNVPLAGTGLAPGSLIANPSSIDFGSVQVGNSKSVYETLTNSSGSSTVTISQAQASGSGYAIVGLTTPLILTPGQHYTFTVTFAPPSATVESGSITVDSDAVNSDLTIPLSGTGSAVPTSQLSVSPSTYAFGSVTDGSNASLPAALVATGASVTVTADNFSNSAFSLSGLSFPVTVNPGQNVPFTVTFTPQGAGPASGTLSFTSNATNSSGASLSGTGVAASHTVSLNWNPSSSQGVDGYNIYRGTQSGGPYSKINASLNAGTNYVDSTVSNGQTYYYVTTAVNSSDQESGYSNQAKAVIPSN
ncbi:MAG TPA: choice-of-anchor D domain-containing protein [Terriglobales bacterium]